MSTTPLTLNDCRARDAADTLRPLRDLFDIPEGVIYLDGNSLGVMPKTAAARAAEVVTQEWGQGLIRSWNTAGWFSLPQRLGNRIAPLIGADADEVVATDSTSVNLFKALAAGLMSVFLVNRHTRAEEESERTDLVRSAVVGRHAPVVAALTVAAGANLAVALGVAAVTLAADELCVTHGAVSRQVRHLEDSLGIALTEGPRHRLKLTEAGLTLSRTLS